MDPFGGRKNRSHPLGPGDAATARSSRLTARSSSLDKNLLSACHFLIKRGGRSPPRAWLLTGQVRGWRFILTLAYISALIYLPVTDGESCMVRVGI